MRLSAADEAFRQDVRFLDTHLDAELREAGLQRHQFGSWPAHAVAQNSLPKRVGGPGWPRAGVICSVIFGNRNARAPMRRYPMGLGMIGPTLTVCGYLPKLLSGEHI